MNELQIMWDAVLIGASLGFFVAVCVVRWIGQRGAQSVLMAGAFFCAAIGSLIFSFGG